MIRLHTQALALDAVDTAVAALRVSEAAGRRTADTVSELLTDVRLRGDTAVAEATARFDWPGATAAGLAVAPEEVEAAYREADPEVLTALRTARENCTFFHRHELRSDWEETGPQGQRLGIRYLPVDRAGLYVPGGQGSYASTVVMNAVPAQVAGVAELIICTPPDRDGRVNGSVLAAAHLLGISRVFRVGGAQAIAAMAYGTESIPRVDVICGPGNAYVMEAKRQVYGAVGIDNLAGPSEVLVVADATARPEWVAADLLAQQEHGSGAYAVLMAESPKICLEVEEALRRSAPGAETTLTAFYPQQGRDFLQVAESLVNAYAPEHLEIHLADARGFLAGVQSAGAVFIGGLTPTAFGDYVAGSNHVLPTGGSARFSSPLSVDTFVRASARVEMTEEAVRLLTPHLARIADSEGFHFHRVSAELRLADRDGPQPA